MTPLQVVIRFWNFANRKACRQDCDEMISRSRVLKRYWEKAVGLGGVRVKLPKLNRSISPLPGNPGDMRITDSPSVATRH